MKPDQSNSMYLPDLFRNPEFYLPFPAGQTIFSEGDPGDVMYVIIEGEVDIQIKGHVISSFGAGDIVGEMALIDAKPRSATTVAKTDCKLAPINQKRFMLLIQQTPQFALHIMRVLADRLRKLDSMIEG